MLRSDLLPLASDRARLRPMRAEDAVAYAEGTDDPEVRTHAHLPAPHYTPASVRAMITQDAEPGLARGDLAVLTIADPGTDVFAGSLVLFDVAEDEAEVGFWMHPAHRGRGLARAALDLAAALAAGSGLRRLRARTVPENTASRALLVRAGFAEEVRVRGTAPSGKDVELLTLERELPRPLELPVETPRLRLRLHREQDRAALHAIYSRPEVARHLLEQPWTEADSRRRIAERLPRTGLLTGEGELALVIEHEGRVIGDVALWLTDRAHLAAEIGWVLDPSAGGQGLATEAVRAVLDLVLEEGGLHRVAARMDARNLASARLAERAGMRREALLREDWWSKGEWTSTLVYGALESDR
jgi:RimJ/RimL family protein N-acetyltransferase